MICEELLARSDADIACRIFASDIDEALLDLARRGVYEGSCMGKLSLERLGAFFTSRADAWTIDPRLAERIEFSRFDLLAEAGSCPPGSIYGNFDLVFCSNLLFYYRSDAQDRIIEKMEACLAPGGYLVTGEAERDIVARRRFRELFPGSAIFQSCA
jgi:chemotaxis methyl-accepting protein methylase